MKKTKIVSISMPEYYWHRLKENAGKAHMSLSAYLVSAGLDYVTWKERKIELCRTKWLDDEEE